jgi:hypothetical protein
MGYVEMIYTCAKVNGLPSAKIIVHGRAYCSPRQRANAKCRIISESRHGTDVCSTHLDLPSLTWR